MGWPRNPALTKDGLDADTDSLTAGRAELEAALDRLNLILLEVGEGATLWSTANDSTMAKLNQVNTFLTTNVFNEDVRFMKTATFDIKVSGGTSIDWRLGNKFWAGVTEGTLSFINPPGPCNLTLLFNGSNLSLPNIVKWPNGGVAPTFSGTTIVSLFWGGSTYFATESTNFL